MKIQSRKAFEIYDMALCELGYTDNMGYSNNDDLKQRAVQLINSIYSDLYYACGLKDFKPVCYMSDEITLPEKVLNDCMHYGVAMKLAQGENDGDSLLMKSALYNQKRAHCTHKAPIIDDFPMPW